MTRLGPSVLSKKMLEGRQSRRRADPRPNPCYGQRLKESWTHKETERAVAERQTPVGVGIRKDLFGPTKSHGYTPEGFNRDKRESSSPRHAVGDERRPRPSESSRSKKSSKEYSTPPQAQGLLSETNTRVPEEELMVINIDSSEESRARLQLQPTPRCAGSASPDLEVAISASPDLWGRALPRPTP